MPILDHFNPPLSSERVWNSFHHAWAATIARTLNRQILPESYFAAPNVQFGPRVEIDVGTFEQAGASEQAPPLSDLVLAAPPSTAVIEAVFPDTVEILIMRQEGGPQVVAAIKLVSPSNKDRPATRRAFVAKMSSYLQQGIALSVIDLVTTRSAQLTCTMNGSSGCNPRRDGWKTSRSPRSMRTATALYGVASGNEIDMWLNALRVGDQLPALVLFLRGDICIEVPLETTYLETCEDQRIAVL